MQTRNAGNLIDTVVNYAKRGWGVFPVAANRKIPLTEHGFKDATTDLPQLRDYYERFPDANVGIATGQRSNLVVIDVDVKNDVDGHKSLEGVDLSQTLAARTPSGGTHFYFLYPNIDIKSRVGILPGVDVRANGGYVVAPPSKIDQFPYEWVNSKEPAPLTKELLELITGGHKNDNKGRFDGTVVEGVRNDTLFRKGCSLRAEGKNELEIRQNLLAINEAHCRPPLPTDEITKIVKSACNYDPDSSIMKGCRVKETLLNIVDATGSELFHTLDGDSYITIFENGHSENWSLQSRHFQNWLCRQAYQRHRIVPNKQQIDDALRALEGRALHEGPQHDVHLRVARLAHDYYIDLCNPDWQAVRIYPGGWEVTGKSKIRFRRTTSMRPLPMPEKGADISDIQDVLNIQQKDLPMVVAFILECYRPDTPYPILELTGSQGAAKSTTQDRIRQCIDPNKVNLRTEPKNGEDIVVAAQHNHVISYNNLSVLSKRLQDILCSISTGGGYSTRALYTNAEEIVLEIRRPILINGINSIATNQDLVDRVLSLELPPISKSNRRTEQELEEEFLLRWPAVFGALLDTFAATLKVLPDIRPKKLERMADFQILGTAMCKATGWPAFDELYRNNRRKSSLDALESSPVAGALITLLDQFSHFEGTFKDLLSKLETYKPYDAGWPKSSRGLSDTLGRQEGALRALGIRLEKLGHSRQGSKIRITKKPSSRPSQQSPSHRSG